MVRLTIAAVGGMTTLSATVATGAVVDALWVGGGSGFIPIGAACATVALGIGAFGVHRASALWRSPVDGTTADLCEVASYDDGTLHLKGGGVGVVVGLGGVDFGSRSDGETASLAEMRAKLLRELAKKNVGVKLIAKRLRQDPITIPRCGHDVLDEINRRWELRFSDASFLNKYFIYIEAAGDGEKTLSEALRAVLEGMREYQPRQLTDGELVGWVAEEIVGRPVVVGGAHDESLYDVARVGFDTRAGRVLHREDGYERETAALSVIGWGVNDTPYMINGFLTLPMEMELLITIKPLNRDALPITLNTDKQQAGKIFASSQVNQEFDEAISRVTDDVDILFETTTTLFLSGTTEQVDQAIGDCRHYAKGFGHEMKAETVAIEAVWRSRLPGVRIPVRSRRLQSVNLAGVMNFDAAPQGLERCDWGEGAVRVFPTISGQPYRLHLHKTDKEKATAHTLIVGPTGSGKSALALHLLSGCLGFNDVRVLAFDSGQGIRPFCEAVGTYSQVGVDCRLNPLQRMEDEKDEKFVNRWLRMIAGIDDDESYEFAERAIAAMRGLPSHRRSLRSCLTSAFEPSELRRGLNRWATSTGLGDLFNNDDDLGFSASITGFALDELYDVPEAAAATVAYIVHRVNKLKKKGDGIAIFIDEAPRLLSNATFRDIVKQWLFEMRKARGAIILAFQTPGEIVNTGIAPAIIESCVTKILLPNSDARWEDYEMLGVTPSQFERLRKPIADEWWALVIRPSEKVALDINLAALGPWLKLYSGGEATVLRMNEAKRDHGENWIWPFVNG